MAWLTGWSYRKKLTLDSSKVDSDCSDFPVKVIFDEGNFAFAHALETGNDVRFTASDGETLLKYERELHQFSTTKWDGFQGTVTGSSSFDISNPDYIAVTSSRKGLMHKYARLATSIDASSDFAFQFGLYLASYSFNVYGSITNIGLDASGDGYYTGEGYGCEEYLGIAVAYRTGINAKPCVYGIFENTRDATTGYALNSTTQYIIKLSKTGTTLKTAVCSSDGTELWSNTATASTTPTLSYYKIVNRYLIDASSSYWTYRLSDFYNGSTEETFQLKAAVYHVKVPTASSTSDTDVYMYYGKADATDGADPTNVWDSNYKVVHHMTPALYDSTSNEHDGSNQGSASAINRAGHYRTFNDAYVSLGSSVNFSLTDKITIEGYCKSTSDTSMRLFSRHEGPSGNYGYLLARSLTYDNAAWYISKTGTDWNGGTTSNDSWPINTDLHIAGTYDGSNMRAYLNGAATLGDFPVSLSGNIASVSHNAYIGAGDATTRKWFGNIYEFRLSNVARSAAWIKATHHSLADTLLTYGSEEALTPTARPRVMVVWA